jgi:hypothetical protein
MPIHRRLERRRAKHRSAQAVGETIEDRRSPGSLIPEEHNHLTGDRRSHKLVKGDLLRRSKCVAIGHDGAPKERTTTAGPNYVIVGRFAKVSVFCMGYVASKASMRDAMSSTLGSTASRSTGW